MADVKFTGLPAEVTIAADAIIPFIKTPGSSPTGSKITFANFKTSLSIPTPIVGDKIVFGLGDGTNVITSGLKKCITIPYACTVVSWTIVADDAADTAGAIVIDIWKDTYANFPPLVGDSMIGAGNKPTIAANGTKAQANAAGWTTINIAAGDILRFNVDSVALLKSVTLVLGVNKV